MKMSNVFSFSRGGCLTWDDEPAANQENETEADDSQCIDSDHASNFWHNWSPTVDRMTIARHAIYLKELVAQIARGEATKQKVREQFKKQAPPPPPPPTTTTQPSNNPFATYWKFPCQSGGKEPRCKWRQHENQQKKASTTTDSTQGFQPVPATTS